MQSRKIKFNWFLFPIAIIYGIVVYIRNRLFEFNILKSKEFVLPVISVGNITVGGTGKTPHVEYLIKLLKDEFVVAALSRGYKRKTNRFIIADKDSTANQIGDEPKQLKQKFPDVHIAVNKDRVKGIEKLKERISDLQAVILDDAYQHRRVKPGLSILLIDFNRPIYKDRLLPVGRLRESAKEMKRANIIIFTKTPATISPIDRRIVLKKIKAASYQSVYFTTLKYRKLISLTGRETPPMEEIDESFKKEGYSILLITGIANPGLLKNHIEQFCDDIVHIKFPDHHKFSSNNIRHIEKKFNSIKNDKKIVLTTEKDAVRFDMLPKKAKIPDNILKHFFYIPIEVEFLDNKEQFNNQIIKYVRENKKYRIIS